MSERRLSLGVNISILVILAIFGVLLSLPLRLLLYTNYYTQEQTVHGSETSQPAENTAVQEMEEVPVDYRKQQRCPKFQYEDQLMSVFRSDYDRNCTYVRVDTVDADPPEEKELEVKEEATPVPEKEAGEQTQESKDIVVAGHILVTMLLASAITALVEVLRIRFAKDKVQDHRRLSAAPRSQFSKLSPVPRQSEVHRLIECQGVSRSNRKRKSGGLLHLFITARV